MRQVRRGGGGGGWGGGRRHLGDGGRLLCVSIDVDVFCACLMLCIQVPLSDDSAR